MPSERKMQRYIFFTLTFIFAAGILVYAFYLAIDSRDTKTNDSETPVAAETTFTVEELSVFDGLGVNKCYVGSDGDIYDVTGSNLFRNGIHGPAGEEAKCGTDLTPFWEFAPHGRAELEGFEIVGKLE